MATVKRVTIRIPEDIGDTWTAWERQAHQEGLTIRDWLFRQVAQSLVTAPPLPDAGRTASAYQALERGRRQGILLGRLDAAFQLERSGDIKPSWMVAWCRRHPEDIPDIVQWCVMQPWGPAFTQWWAAAIRPGLPATVDSADGSP